jgi:glycerol-3-phosphate cytidylyltransferase
MVIYTVGTFDMLHVGHLALLEYCKTLGDVVAVGVASDSVVNSYKPNVPVIPLDQREEMLKGLRCVDIVRPYHELEYVSACKELNVDIFVIGEDWGDKPHNIAVESYLKTEGKEIIQVLYNPRTSSTQIKQNVIDQRRGRHIEQAVSNIDKNIQVNNKYKNHISEMCSIST